MATTTLPTTPQTTELTNQDRCDACGAQAYVRVTIPIATTTSSLHFCGHHFTHEHEPAIAAKGYLIHDERDRLNRKLTSGSAFSA